MVIQTLCKNDEIGALEHQKWQWKKIAWPEWKAVEIEKSTLKVKNQNDRSKNMVNLVLQHKQIYNIKSSKFVLSTKNTMLESPKTWTHLYRKLLVIQNILILSFAFVLFVLVCCICYFSSYLSQEFVSMFVLFMYFWWF